MRFWVIWDDFETNLGQNGAWHGSVKLRRLKLYATLDAEILDSWAHDDCCPNDIIDSETDLDLIDSCFADSSDLSDTEKASLYYICGYVTFKENIVCIDENETVELPEAEFTNNVNRGKLKLPPINLYDFSQYCYTFFKSRKEKCCTKMYLQAFQLIHEYTGYSFENIDSIVRRLCNCFFKAFVKRETDKLKRKNKDDQKDTRRTKSQRLSAKD